ncbi:Glutamine synthetase [Thalassovita gelatinovora]|uniref:Glutamine synthetase n=1 Tax=Thalassovita gelatinovora TaxID=53501 RepID=A0A0N7LUI9_THAGE|nr:glutamine synthetase family protein [Thalassovita gelatinovora]QIZ79166.1 glutamine synthetase [Thalassovita gelatinovora]CUH63626.1 Glutamine synthetase [Thalassovita gelatinovora]SER00670.1 glutamine synthetase [Thalassovita gelatinovora]
MTSSFLTQISSGRLAQDGLLNDNALREAAELLARIDGSDLETVRIVFADQHGLLRGKTVTAASLASVFRSGLNLPATLLLKDTSNRTVFPIWDGSTPGVMATMAGAGDMLLVPDPLTFRILPWSPHSAWLFCDPYTRDGQSLPFAPRPVLRRAVEMLDQRGLGLTVGLEVEFHVFTRKEESLSHHHAGMPGQPPQTELLDQGYQYLSETNYDRLEPVMDMLRRNAQALGLPVRSTEVEMGPSQFEFTFEPASAMAHADNMIMFRTMVKEVCAREGLHATFMCRPKTANSASSGWHLHQSLTDAEGKNVFIPSEQGQLTPEASAWIAGLLAHAPESCLLTTPTVNGYKRYQPFQLAPDRIEWGYDNRGAMVRALMAPGDGASRVENRVAEPAANPYFYFASQILSGISGLDKGMTAPSPVETPYNNAAEALPPSLIAAIEAFERGGLFRDVLGDDFADYMSTLKRAEWKRYLSIVTEWEQHEYFGIF